MADLLVSATLDSAWIFAIYMIVAFAILAPRYSGEVKTWLFSTLNVMAALYVFFPWTGEGFPDALALILFAGAHFAVINHAASGTRLKTLAYWVAILSPILMLVLFKAQTLIQLVGASYMAFRMFQCAFENADRARIRFVEYFGFLFYLPTIASGPINPYKNYVATANGAGISRHNLTQGVFRILIGYIKFRFLAALPLQLTLTTLWGNGQYEIGLANYAVAGAAYYVYLYLNLGGFTDIVVGLSALLGIKVKENLNRPFMAVDIMDFWSRWHMSLTHLVRDAIFSPFVMTLTRWLGLRYAGLAAILAIFCIFTVLAMWHGTAPGYFIFYMLHATAFALVYFLDQSQRRLGSKAYRALRENPLRQWIGRLGVFIFLSLTCPFLEWPAWEQLVQFPFF